eukprot:5094358-Amphidinium_carterae.1
MAPGIACCGRTRKTRGSSQLPRVQNNPWVVMRWHGAHERTAGQRAGNQFNENERKDVQQIGLTDS